MTKFYMIGNTHFDPVWEWTWDEAMASIRATFRSALDRMKEYPDFCYSFSSPPVFEWIKKTDPDMFEEIKQRVTEGRWDLAEGWWNQPDCFTAMGESYIRQGLYGQRYLLKNFGQYSECAFNTDSFGHPNMLPQILSKSGIKYYCFCRPEERHYHLESPFFKWKSCDGSSVLAFRINGNGEGAWIKEVKNALDKVSTYDEKLLVIYGVTDHGGAPTKKSIEEITAYDGADFSTVSGFFKNHQAAVNEIEDEFITGDFGVYCNNTSVKQLNRKAEYALLNAEKSCVIAKENHTDELAKCWQDVLFNQFHDILGGASIKNAYTDAQNLYGRAIQTAQEITHFNLQRLTAQMKMPGKNPDNEWNIVLWNLNCCAFNGYTEAEVQWAHEFDWYDKGITLEDENGNQIRTQIIAEHSAIPRFRSRFLLKAYVPPMGYRTFKLIKDNTDIPAKKKATANIETNRFIYTVSDRNGSIEEIYDKRLHKAIVKNLCVPACYEDDGDTWCFNIQSYGNKKGEFSLLKAELTESGEFIDKLMLTSKYNNSIMYMYYTFYKNEDYFDVEYRVNWNEEHTVFKFDNYIADDRITVATPYGQMERAKSVLDRPMGEWLKTNDLLYLTGSNFSYNFYDNTLGITVLRSPVYGDFRIGELAKRDYMIMEQGITEGMIRIMHGKTCANPSDEAMKLNNPPIIVCESNHDGKLPTENSYISLIAENATIGAVKYSEDDSGVIVRIVDHSGKKQAVVLSFMGETYKFTLNANEIKTLKINESKISQVNLLEAEK